MTDEGRETNIFFITIFFAVCLLLGVLFLYGSYRLSEGLFYNRIAAVAVSMPGERQEIMQALKNAESLDIQAGKELLRRYGYTGQLPIQKRYLVFFLGGFFFASICTSMLSFQMYRNRKRLKVRVEGLTQYLRQVEEGCYSISLKKKQDIFSQLEDEIYKTVLALRESRERLRWEKEKLADNLADISHQFKTPLTSLTVLSELLLRRTSGTGNVQLIQTMEKQTEHLTELTAALLTLSRADAGVLSFEIRDIPVSELIECSLEPLLPVLEKREQNIKILGEHNTLENLFLSCDLGWTKEALGNLIKNSSEHAPEQTDICIRISDNPIFSSITVEDSGIGFSQKDLPHLFERFYKGENARKDSSGIGLSLAKSLIEGQKGEIRAENRKEGGARFLIKFYKNI